MQVLTADLTSQYDVGQHNHVMVGVGTEHIIFTDIHTNSWFSFRLSLAT